MYGGPGHILNANNFICDTYIPDICPSNVAYLYNLADIFVSGIFLVILSEVEDDVCSVMAPLFFYIYAKTEQGQRESHLQ